MDALGNPIALALTPGQIHDLVPAPELLAQADPQAVIADKAFDADTFIDPLLSSGVVPVIPPRSSRKRVRSCDYALYRERNLVERFFNKLKHFRGIATRYNKLARTFATQMEALRKHRNGGQQRVRVEHVHVHPGGQAIVGDVHHGGRGAEDGR